MHDPAQMKMFLFLSTGNGGGLCLHHEAYIPPTCTIPPFACYAIEWYTNGFGVQKFKMCPTGELAKSAGYFACMIDLISCIQLAELAYKSLV